MKNKSLPVVTFGPPNFTVKKWKTKAFQLLHSVPLIFVWKNLKQKHSGCDTLKGCYLSTLKVESIKSSRLCPSWWWRRSHPRRVLRFFFFNQNTLKSLTSSFGSTVLLGSSLVTEDRCAWCLGTSLPPIPALTLLYRACAPPSSPCYS